MATRKKTTKADSKADSKADNKPDAKSKAKAKDKPSLEKVKNFSHDLLLAGIGAWASSRDKKKSDKDKGLPDFATLVREGRKAEPELKASLQKTWDEWKEKSSNSRLSKSGGQLRGVFDERVSSAISGLGLPTRKEIDALEAKVDRLMNDKGGTRGGAAKKAGAKKAAGAAQSDSAAKKASAPAKRAPRKAVAIEGEPAAGDVQ